MMKEARIHVLLIAAWLTVLSNAQPCGVTQFITKETPLDRSDFIVAEQEFPENENGAALSAYGWIQLTDDAKRDHPIFKLKFLANEDAEAPATFENVFSYSYDNSADSPVLKFKYARTGAEFGEGSEPFEMPLSKWLFWAVSFDYAAKKMKFAMRGAGASVAKEFETDFD